MRHTELELLRSEARAFALRFACEDCAHFDARAGVCAHGYVERPRPGDLDPGSTSLAFCKEFELGDGPPA